MVHNNSIYIFCKETIHSIDHNYIYNQYKIKNEENKYEQFNATFSNEQFSF